MTREQLKVMASECLADARALVNHNREEARVLVRTAMVFNRELAQRQQIEREGFWKYN